MNRLETPSLRVSDGEAASVGWGTSTPSEYDGSRGSYLQGAGPSDPSPQPSDHAPPASSRDKSAWSTSLWGRR